MRGPCRNDCPMRAHNQSINQSINQSMLTAYQSVSSWKYSGILSDQELCLWSRSSKIQRLLSFNSAVEINFKNVTDGLDQEKYEIQPFPPITAKTNFFLDFFSYRSTALHFSFPTFLLRWSAISIHIYVHNWEIATREDDFREKRNLDSAVNATLKVLPFVL